MGAPLFQWVSAPRHRMVPNTTTADVTAVLNSGFAAIERYAYDHQRMPEGPWTDIYSVAAVLHLGDYRPTTPWRGNAKMVADTMPPMRGDVTQRLLEAVH
jgi:hypothetical protein